MGKVSALGKPFRILGLEERKGRLVEEQDFHGSFQVKLYGFLPFPLASLTKSCSCWYGLKDLSTLTKLSLTLKMDDFTSGRRNVDLYRWFGEVQGQMG